MAEPYDKYHEHYFLQKNSPKRGAFKSAYNICVLNALTEDLTGFAREKITE
jgi:hypothetical protein